MNHRDNTCGELKLEKQLCFPLYACARRTTGHYKPYLDELGLTYTQYVTMMVLWEKGEQTSREIGRRLFLDSGTLTPLLKKLEKKGLVTRLRSEDDGRNLTVRLTEKGLSLRDSARDIPQKAGECMPLTDDEARELYRLLCKILKEE